MRITIDSKRCYLRQLSTNDDLTHYLYWMQTPTNNPYILSATSSYNLIQLKEFIESCNSRKDVFLLGIFMNQSNLHIGNIKFDQVNLITKSATLGILIGNRNYRGKGIAREVILASILWLASNYDIKTIKLGVDPSNLNALNLYLKIGFRIIEKSKNGGYIMQATTKELCKF